MQLLIVIEGLISLLVLRRVLVLRRDFLLLHTWKNDKLIVLFAENGLSLRSNLFDNIFVVVRLNSDMTTIMELFQ